MRQKNLLTRSFANGVAIAHKQLSYGQIVEDDSGQLRFCQTHRRLCTHKPTSRYTHRTVHIFDGPDEASRFFDSMGLQRYSLPDERKSLFLSKRSTLT